MTNGRETDQGKEKKTPQNAKGTETNIMCQKKDKKIRKGQQLRQNTRMALANGRGKPDRCEEMKIT